ncbi:sigma factor-like helix-turn-helix DNA-binding protein [Chengkuizengella marina]|uniref:RNA polymerase subunit sigma-24 n=1 Tax=Chengkuizengella marina TaxID=2507566 RepID=A0A6N9Q909_9BACL|nr:sigma factor-like helix-turn-helix DNA-binding protein [Chengkuizengella marina]NBI31171.1 RNA polymerase subunit sigma-24 [Chengkuizengella marina]
MELLLEEYKNTKKSLMKLKENTSEEHERKTIGSMITSCDYVIRWIEKGGEPDSIRGIERRSVYQNTHVWDPIWMQSFASPESCGSFTTLSDFQRYQIEDALSTLTERERECYELHFGKCFSYEEIAGFLKVRKGTVQNYMKRAEVKIKASKLSSLFLQVG